MHGVFVAWSSGLILPILLVSKFVLDGGDSAGAIAALAASRLRIELAILAAKLATRQADVDSLFRANAELAHTNVRLQNEIDEYEEKVESSSGEPTANQVEELQVCADEPCFFNASTRVGNLRPSCRDHDQPRSLCDIS